MGQQVFSFPLGGDRLPFLFLYEGELGLRQGTEWHRLWHVVVPLSV